MSQFSAALRMVGAMVIAAGITAHRGQAQTETPTETPGDTPTATGSPLPTPTCAPPSAALPCTGTKKVQVSWFAKDPFTARVVVSGTHCEAPVRCEDVSGDLVTVPPITVTITDAAGQSLSKTITAPGVNMNGCPGGHDTYRSPTERLRFVYGAATTVVGKMRAPQPNPTPLALTPPLKFTVQDSCGYAVEGTVSTCFLRQSSKGTVLKSTYLKCF
jgi:hypothetical protein